MRIISAQNCILLNRLQGQDPSAHLWAQKHCVLFCTDPKKYCPSPKMLFTLGAPSERKRKEARDLHLLMLQEDKIPE